MVAGPKPLCPCWLSARGALSSQSHPQSRCVSPAICKPAHSYGILPMLQLSDFPSASSCSKLCAFKGLLVILSGSVRESLFHTASHNPRGNTKREKTWGHCGVRPTTLTLNVHLFFLRITVSGGPVCAGQPRVPACCGLCLQTRANSSFLGLSFP